MAASAASTGSRLLDDIAAVIGEEAALRLSARYRGLSIYILKSYPDGHDVVTAIGRAAADELSAHYWGRTLYIAEGPGIEWGVNRLASRGQLNRWEIADTLRIGERKVYRILKRRDDRANDSQGDLFDAA